MSAPKVIPHHAFVESTTPGKGKTVLVASGGAHNGRNVALDAADAALGNEFLLGDWRDQHLYKIHSNNGTLYLLQKYETPGYGGTNP